MTTKPWIATPLALALLTALPACSEDLSFADEDLGGDEHDDHADDDDQHDSGAPDSGDERVEHEALADGVLITTIDATDEAAPVYLDLDTSLGLAGAEDGWDLGFWRFNIKLAGGVSGDAGVEVAIVEGAEFESLTAVPDDAAWITDAPDGDDEDEDPDLALRDWYDYDFMTHVLTPKDRVYLIRSSDGAVYKLQILDYYSDAGTSGFLQFTWAPLG